MLHLGPDEQVTLELVATRGEPVVLSGAALCGLHGKGLVEFSEDGWTVTPFGRYVADAMDRSC